MTGEDFRAALETLSLTQGGAARFLDVDERTVRRWVTDGPPRSVELLLRLIQRHELNPADL